LGTKGTEIVLESTPHTNELVKGIGLTSAIALVMGSMIGSGIFIVSADIARLVGSPVLLICTWILTGIMVVGGALAYGELAVMMPHAGGQYIYLREALGPLWGFLYGWTSFLVIQTGTIAAVGMAFGKFLGVLVPSISSSNWLLHLTHVPLLHLGPVRIGDIEIGLNTQNAVAILVVAFLTGINILGVKTGAAVQVVVTAAKAILLLSLIALGIFVGRNVQAISSNFGGSFWQNSGWQALHAVRMGTGASIVTVGSITILALAQVGPLFSSEAWSNVTFASGEVKNPQRTLPMALAIGSGAVIALYILTNFAYLCVLPLAGTHNALTILNRGIQYASEDRVGTAMIEQIFGPIGAKIMAGAILVSCFGAANGLILAGARVYYAMAKNGLFFHGAASVHPKYRTPAGSLVIQCVWACILCISGSYAQLLDYIVFAVVMFYVLTLLSVFALRFKRPHDPRPYRAVGYPLLTATNIAIAIYIDAVLLRYKPQYTWPGLIIVLLGVPFYFLIARGNASRMSSVEVVE
jgi:basic amino acid/polyamine antiporter, APA family